MQDNHDSLFRKMLLATAPLLLWGAHFVFLYVFVAASCIAGMSDVMLAGVPAQTAVLLLESAAAIVAAGVLLLRSARTLKRRGSQVRLVEMAYAGSALLALIAIVWASLPVLFLRTCN